jgi:hypothetical protein
VVGMFSAGHQASNAFAQPHWRLPTAILEGCGLWFEPPLSMPTDCGGVARGPGPFPEGTTRMGIPGCGHGPLPASLTAGGFRGDQPQAFHQWPGVSDACAVPECSHGGDGPGELDATQGLERFDDRRYRPGLDLVLAFALETPQACRVFVDRPDICLKDHWLSGCGTDHRREPGPTGARFIDQDQVLGFGLQLAHELGNVGLPGANSAEEDDLRVMRCGHIGHRNRRLMDIPSDKSALDWCMAGLRCVGFRVSP